MWPFGGKGLTADEFRQHVQMHLDAFKKTRLCISAEGKTHAAVYDWAVEQGVAARRDGVCGNSDGGETLRAFGKAPGVFEFFGSYTWMKEKGWWDGIKDKNGQGHKLADCVERGKPSYIGLSHGGKESLQFLDAERPLIERLANRMGYHFVVTEAAAPKTIAAGTPFTLKLSGVNRGVAFIYVPCVLAVALLDAEGRAVETAFCDSAKPSRWEPDKPWAEEMQVAFKSAKPGQYRLVAGLFQSRDAKAPAIKFANEGRTAEGWQPLLAIEVK
jgi:hypothetical protein